MSSRDATIRSFAIVTAAVCVIGLALWFMWSLTPPDMDPPAGRVTSLTSAKTPTAEPDSDLALHPSMKSRRFDAAVRDIVQREDPVVDGWDTERFSELADHQLKILGELLCNPQQIEKAALESVCTEQYQGKLCPEDLSLEFEDAHFVVRRNSSSTPVAEVQGREALRSALKQQTKTFYSGAVRRFKFKTIRVELSGDTARTTSYFQISSLPSAGANNESDSDVRDAIQVSATWDCVWKSGAAEYPLLERVVVSGYECVNTRESQSFVDATLSQFEGVDAFEDQFVYGRDHWYSSLEGSIGVEGRGNGIAIGDVNGDQLEDVYVCQPAALPNKLFLRASDGSLKDVSRQSGVDWLDSTRSALFVDMDNDGDQDLVLTVGSRVLLHANNGRGEFRVTAAISTISNLFSINAADFDNDGDLDLYVCGYSGIQQIRPEDIFASPVPYHDANNGAPNLLLRNEGGWQFSDVTEAAGLGTNNLKFSLASVCDDFDSDGDLDIYVANDFGRNNLYRNDGGVFVDMADEAGVEDIGPGMSAASGDFNNDGRPDLYVSNMFSSAGSRITHNPQFKPTAGKDDLQGFQRHARGNSLFMNVGDGKFQDRSEESGTMMGRWAWGSQFVDINNDGWRDVYVTNGFVTADNNNDL